MHNFLQPSEESTIAVTAPAHHCIQHPCAEEAQHRMQESILDIHYHLFPLISITYSVHPLTLYSVELTAPDQKNCP